MGYNYWPIAYPRLNSNEVEARMSDYIPYMIMTSQQSRMIIMASLITGELLFVKQIAYVNNKQNIKLRITGHLLGKSTGPTCQFPTEPTELRMGKLES